MGSLWLEQELVNNLRKNFSVNIGHQDVSTIPLLGKKNLSSDKSKILWRMKQVTIKKHQVPLNGTQTLLIYTYLQSHESDIIQIQH